MVGPVGDGETGSDVAGVIDIGTNTVHMVLARRFGDGRVEVIDRYSDAARLGGGPDPRHLDDDAVARGIEALKRCGARAAAAGVEPRAVATAAVRDADNREEFVDRVRAEVSMEVDVLSGDAEARYVHLGVLSALPVAGRRFVVCDIGGGSTELLAATGEAVGFVASVQWGAVRLTRRFLDDGWGSDAIGAARETIREAIGAPAAKALVGSPELLVGTSGTISTIGAMAAVSNGSWAGNGASLSRSSVAEVIEALRHAGSPQLAAELPAMPAKRAEILLAGALALDEVMGALGMSQLTYSAAALRDGVLIDQWRRAGG